jgi:aminopeptidase N
LRKNERDGYLNSLQQSGTHPLIYYGYNDKEDMFDGHSYNKGGLILHMLRHYLGDEAFYASLNNYLVKNAYSAVESDELRMSFEDTFGEDLNWFFDQWFYKAGHPELEIDYEYDSLSNEVVVLVSQMQDPETSAPIYQLPVTISVYDQSGSESTFDTWINKRNQEIRLPYGKTPGLVIFDKNDILLFTKKEKKTNAEYANQYMWSKVFKHRLEALEMLGTKVNGQNVMLAALEDPQSSIRVKAIDNLKISGDQDIIQQIAQKIQGDPHSAVRAAAIKKLSSDQSIDLSPILNQVFESEQSYNVLATALMSLNKIDVPVALQKAKMLKEEKAPQIVGAVAQIFAQTGDAEYLPYFESKLNNISLYQVFNFYDQYFEILKDQPTEILNSSSAKLENIALNSVENIFYRFLSTTTLSKLKEYYSEADPAFSIKVGSLIERIKAEETNEILKQRYSSY